MKKDSSKKDLILGLIKIIGDFIVKIILIVWLANISSKTEKLSKDFYGNEDAMKADIVEIAANQSPNIVTTYNNNTVFGTYVVYKDLSTGVYYLHTSGGGCIVMVDPEGNPLTDEYYKSKG